MSASAAQALPSVTVIVPMFNEEAYIEACIGGFTSQSYRGPLEILIVDGGSTDRSSEIVQQIAAVDTRVRLVHNERRRPAAAANVGVAEATGEILCFLSAHGEPGPTYIEASVEALLSTQAAGVGGTYEHAGTTPRSKAIGLAMSSRFGMASTHRTASQRREVDTISHPTFWRQAILDAGGYDEGLSSNEDYELNYRVRTLVGPLIFSPEIHSVYRPRGSLRALARQFHAYGRGKAEVARRHPSSLQARHLLPPVLVLALLAAPVLAWSPTGRRLLAAGAIGYVGVTAAAVEVERPRSHGASIVTFVAALPTMHVSWGSGVLRGLLARRRG